MNLAIVFLPIIITLAVAVIYFFYYKSSINKHLNDEDYQEKHYRPSPGTLGAVIMAVALIVTSTKDRYTIRNLEQQINNLNSQIYQLSEDVREIADAGKYKFDYTVEVDKLFKENGKYYVTYTLTVLPETFRNNETLSVFMDDGEIFLTRDGNKYTGQFTRETLSQEEAFTMMIRRDNERKAEEIYLNPGRIVGGMFMFIDISGSSGIQNNTLKVKMHAVLMNKEERTLKAASLVVEDKGEIIRREDLSELRDREIDFSFKEKISSEENVSMYVEFSDTDGNTYLFNLYSPSYTGDCDDYVYEVRDSAGTVIVRY